MKFNMLEEIVERISCKQKGILAADESNNTIGKRFAAIDVENTLENRRAYRSLLATTPNLSDYISGVILFEETLFQLTEAKQSIPQVFANSGIIPGIKVDTGLVALSSTNQEKIARGIDTLSERLEQYKESEVKFAKFRTVYEISTDRPSKVICKINAQTLARYAAISQDAGIVPIVEPEVLMNGSHTIDTCEAITTEVLAEVFNTLREHNVYLEGIILKPNMIVAGLECAQQPSIEQVAESTVRVLKRTVPAAVATINFLSGGQSAVLASQHLAAMNRISHSPWNLSFSYGRALQEDCQKAWSGSSFNIATAQQVLYATAKRNGLACTGETC